MDFFLANNARTNIGPYPLDLFRFADNVPGLDPGTPGEFTVFPRFLFPRFAAITDEDPRFGAGPAERIPHVDRNLLR